MFIAPLRKSGAILDFGCPPFRHNFVSTQYLDKKFIRILPKFVYALILTRSRLGMIPVIFANGRN